MDVLLQGIHGTTRAAHGAKWQNLSLINPWLLGPLHIPPDESQNWLVGWQKESLVEHTFNVTTHRNQILPELNEDT